METWILLGVGLAIYALIDFLLSGTKKNTGNTGGGAGHSGGQASGASPSNASTRSGQKPSPPPLPPRRSCPPPRVPNPEAASGLGPRGIYPHQFPCCPICRQRNGTGAQKIFWNDREELYSCSRGHKFQKNGKPFLS